MTATEPQFVWLNRPRAVYHTTTWNPPPPHHNPRVNGILLVIVAKLVAAADFVKRFLWHNAGLGVLFEHPALSHTEPRYEPVVIKASADRIHSAASEDLAAADASALTEDWKSKSAHISVYRSAIDYHQAYLTGKVTPEDVAKSLLPLVRRDLEKRSVHSTAFLESREDLILQAAIASTQRYAQGRPLSLLDGVPMAVKDENDMAGYGKCYGTTMDFKNKDDITTWCVQRWIDAGAIMVGRTNMHEMGMDTTNNNPNYGTPTNPHNDRYYTGGSSGGSAYAVSAGLVPISMGNDGGGSIRIPAAFCGVYGLKPSHGRVSILPSTCMAKSTVVTGPIAANMVDLEIAWRILARSHPSDPDAKLFLPPTSVSWPLTAPRKKTPLGIYRPWFDVSDAPVRSLCNRALTHLSTSGNYELVEISMPLISEGQIAHGMTILNEAVSCVTAKQMSQLTPANQILLHAGSQTSAAFLLQAQKLRHVLMQHLVALYDRYPGLVIVTPTTPNAGWNFHPSDLVRGVTDANTQLKTMTYVWLANFTGCPAITCPVGYVDPVPNAGAKGQIPVGLMGMGEWADEDSLIQLGYELERYLATVHEGGRRKPGRFVDVLTRATESARQS